MDADLALRAVCRALVLPPGGPILLAAVGLALVRRAPVAGRLTCSLALAGLLALSLPVTSIALGHAVERVPPLDPSLPIDAEAIVVLAGGVSRDTPVLGRAQLTRTTLERLAGGAALARRTGLPLLLSGGSPRTGPPEADVMQETLRADFGLEARWLERRSRTTRENALETATLLRTAGLRRIVLVTSALHMPRAVAEFESAGLVVRPAPVGGTSVRDGGWYSWLPNPEAFAHSSEALYEVAGGIVARLGRAAPRG